MQTYRLELLPEDCAAIVGALSNHPYRQVAPLIDKIKQQCAEQDKHLEDEVESQIKRLKEAEEISLGEKAHEAAMKARGG